MSHKPAKAAPRDRLAGLVATHMELQRHAGDLVRAAETIRDIADWRLESLDLDKLLSQRGADPDLVVASIAVRGGDPSTVAQLLGGWLVQVTEDQKKAIHLSDEYLRLKKVTVGMGTIISTLDKFGASDVAAQRDIILWSAIGACRASAQFIRTATKTRLSRIESHARRLSMLRSRGEKNAFDRLRRLCILGIAAAGGNQRTIAVFLGRYFPDSPTRVASVITKAIGPGHPLLKWRRFLEKPSWLARALPDLDEKTAQARVAAVMERCGREKKPQGRRKLPNHQSEVANDSAIATSER
jgi:hypothetical protein